MSRLEQALLAVTQWLTQHQVPHMVIGGIANVLWGVPRTTLDVDITIWVAEDRLESFTASITQAFAPRVTHPAAFVTDTRVLPLATPEGVSVDLIFGQLPYEQEAIQRAARQVIQGTEVFVCQPEDLILHKLVSERPRDLDDVKGIIQQQRGRLDCGYLDLKVAALARALDRPDIQAWYAQCLRDTDPET